MMLLPKKLDKTIQNGRNVHQNYACCKNEENCKQQIYLFPLYENFFKWH